MRRVIPIAALAAFGAAAAAHLIAHRGRPVDVSGNGHAPGKDRAGQLRARIADARRRLRDELDALRDK
jgi:hypothetical protein